MLVSRIPARIMQHAKLALQTETISVCVLMDLDLKAIIANVKKNEYKVYSKIRRDPISR